MQANNLRKNLLVSSALAQYTSKLDKALQTILPPKLGFVFRHQFDDKQRIAFKRADDLLDILSQIRRCADASMRNERPANEYAEPLVEASRKSATNDNPYLSTDGHPVILLGRNYCNSARIAGQLQFGIVDVTEIAEFVLPANAQWSSFADFSKSTDVMTKAALFDYLLLQHHKSQQRRRRRDLTVF